MCAFDTIFAQKVPVIHRSCSIALLLRLTKIEEGEHKLKISFIDNDGKNIVPPMDGQIECSLGGDQTSKAINLILNLQGLQLPHFGEYRIDLAINGRHEASLPLFLREMKD